MSGYRSRSCGGAHLLIVTLFLLMIFIQPAHLQLRTTTPRATGKKTLLTLYTAELSNFSKSVKYP